jgi:hypothetical protein
MISRRPRFILARASASPIDKIIPAQSRERQRPVPDPFSESHSARAQ